MASQRTQRTHRDSRSIQRPISFLSSAACKLCDLCATSVPSVTALLSVEHLSILAPDTERPIVDDLSFSISAGETLAVVGESGAGKTMTGLAVLGLVPPPLRVSTGTVNWRGRDLLRLPERELRAIRGVDIGLVFQEPSAAIDPAMKVGAQIAEVLQVHRGLGRAAAKTRAIALMDRVRIADAAHRSSAYAHEMSGGMLQRVAIAIAIACAPKLLIADEPTTALDASVQRGVLELLAELQRELGMAMLFVTHNLGLVAEMADRVLVMRHGRMVEQAGVYALFENPQAEYTRELLAASPRAPAHVGPDLAFGPSTSDRKPGSDSRSGPT
jgi:ABC-type dipeptide/oligopeptide/nickel transport system ATPase component